MNKIAFQRSRRAPDVITGAVIGVSAGGPDIPDMTEAAAISVVQDLKDMDHDIVRA